MTHAERMAAISSIACAVCKHFAWHSFMWPIRRADGWHHPSCGASSTVKPGDVIGAEKKP